MKHTEAHFRPATNHIRGFTLIEMVVVIVVSTILLAFVANFMTVPMDAYLAQKRRSEFIGDADRLMRTLASDVRTAVPNSIRFTNVGADSYITLLPAVATSTYKVASGDLMTFPATVHQFVTMGIFANVAPTYVVIGNLGSAGKDAYQLTNVISGNISIANSASESTVTVNSSGGSTFTSPSPSQRVYGVNGPVSYWCSQVNRTVIRYQNHTIAAVAGSPTNPGAWIASGATQSIVASNVGSCFANQDPPVTALAQGGGLLNLTMTLNNPATAANSAETITLFQQFRVENDL